MKLTTLTTALVACLVGAPSAIIAAPTAEVVNDGAATAALERRQSQATKMTATDNLLFSSSLATFLTKRDSKNPSYLIWTSDGCTDSPDNPFTWDFYKACYRHDFGYRNYKDQKRFTTTNKDQIDAKFLQEYVAVALEFVSNNRRENADRGCLSFLTA